MTRILLALLFALASIGVAHADDFFNNDAEPGCVRTSPGGPPTNPNFLMCDGFEDGTYVVDSTSNGAQNPGNDGWQLVTDNGVQGGAACGGIGAAGTSCARVATLTDGGASGGSGVNAMPGTHALYNTPNNSLLGLRVRMYLKFMPGYVFCPSAVTGCQQKFTSGQMNAHNGGISFYGIGRNLSVMNLCPTQDCQNLSFQNPQRNGCNDGASQYLCQNQGNAITMTPGNYYYMEYRVVLNDIDVQNGIWQLWINDCGPNGLCTGSPTLRASYTNVRYRGTGFQGTDNGLIGGYYLDLWGNKSDEGTIRIDNIVIAKDANGVIGFFAGAIIPPANNPTLLKGCSGSPSCIPQ